MYGKVNWFALIFVFVLVLWVSFLLGYLIGQEVYDPRFFTYFNYALGFAFYNLGFISFFSVEIYEFWCVFLVPVYLNTTGFVFFAIVVIVALNDWVFTRGTALGGTNRTIGETHTGDWLLHYLPLVFLVLVILVINRSYIEFVTNYWNSMHKTGKVFYVFYVFIVPLAFLLIYMITMPFDQNYPTNLSTLETTLLVFGLSLGISAVFLTGILVNQENSNSMDNIITTPAGMIDVKIKPT